MNHRTLLSSGFSARFLLAAVGLSVAVSACGDDDPGPYDGGGGSSSGGTKAGSSGSGTTAGTAGKNGTAGSDGNGGSGGSGGSNSGNAGDGGGGEPNPEGGSGGSLPQGGAGGEPNGEAGASQGGSGEGGQGGAPPEGPAKHVVFADGYAEGVGFVAFGESANDLSVDATTAHSGTSSLKIQVGAAGYTGGALVGAPQDLSQYNALSFWVKASAEHALNTVGFGNDGVGGDPLFASRDLLPLTTAWQRVVIPLPSPSKLAAEKGLFYFAEGNEGGVPYTIWVDDVEFTTVEGISAPVPAILTETRNLNVGASQAMPNGSAQYTIGGVTLPFSVGRGNFDYISSDEGVAGVTNGVLTAEAAGTTEITAELEGVLATGKITVNASVPTVPTVAAPTPTQAAVDVISLFSDAYTGVPVSTWSTSWDQTNLEDLLIAGNATKLYSSLNYAGIEFTTPVIDASAMTHFHMDVWMPTSTQFRIKLVDFGANGVYQGPTNDDSEGGVTKAGLTPQAWQSLEFALSDFTPTPTTGLQARAHLAQLIIEQPSGTTVYVDNVYFYKQAP